MSYISYLERLEKTVEQLHQELQETQMLLEWKEHRSQQRLRFQYEVRIYIKYSKYGGFDVFGIARDDMQCLLRDVKTHGGSLESYMSTISYIKTIMDRWLLKNPDKTNLDIGGIEFWMGAHHRDDVVFVLVRRLWAKFRD
jgi:hypothetical protein